MLGKNCLMRGKILKLWEKVLKCFGNARKKACLVLKCYLHDEVTSAETAANRAMSVIAIGDIFVGCWHDRLLIVRKWLQQWVFVELLSYLDFFFYQTTWTPAWWFWIFFFQASDANDTEVLSSRLFEITESDGEVSDTFSEIRGPYSFVFYYRLVGTENFEGRSCWFFF